MTKHILTTIVLWLSMFAFAAAQPRGDGKDMQWDQNLAGLGEIGLIVKYGQADGLPEAMQPAILQVLRDRARDLLRKGEVRLVESTDEAKMVGKPRLVVTVRLKKQTDLPPAVTVDTDLYRKVRLSRDPSKELELPIWNASNIGPEITERNLVSLLEGQLNAFVKTYQAVNAKSPQASVAEVPSPVKADAHPMEGLLDIGFWFSIAFNRVEGVPPVDLDPQVTNPELRRTLESEAEKKLQRAGIALRRIRPDQMGQPHFMMMLIVNEASVDKHTPPISVTSTFWQTVRLARNPQTETFMPTWRSHKSEGWPITEEALRRLMNSQLDQFIEAYKTANPKSSASN
jgi:hypothetical protein